MNSVYTSGIKSALRCVEITRSDILRQFDETMKLSNQLEHIYTILKRINEDLQADAKEYDDGMDKEMERLQDQGQKWGEPVSCPDCGTTPEAMNEGQMPHKQI